MDASARLVAAFDGDLQHALSLLPEPAWCTLEVPQLGRAEDHVALAIGPPGVYVLTAVPMGPQDRIAAASGASGRRRDADVGRALRRLVRVTRGRLSGALGRVVVVRGIAAVPGAGFESRQLRHDVEILGLETLPSRLILAPGRTLEPHAVPVVAELAADPATWRSRWPSLPPR